MEKIFKLEKSTMIFRKDEIVEIRFKDDVTIDLEESKAQFEIIIKERGHNPVCYLILPGHNNDMTHEVRAYANTPECKAISKAEAVVVSNLAQRMVTNFMLKFVDKNMKMFGNKADAEKWLQKQQLGDYESVDTTSKFSSSN